MPDLKINIGGRAFDVACQPGEEEFLQTAAALLNAEAMAVMEQGGRIPEPRMLLMAGLMLADKAAGLDEQLRAAETALGEAAAEIERLNARPEPEPERIEVPVIPAEVQENLAEMAARAEALAAAIEEKV